MAEKLAWSAQYKHPKWQKKRLEAMEDAGFVCENCGDTETTLNVHHKHYVKGRMIWEYSNEELSVLCEPCHEIEHQDKEILLRVLVNGGLGTTRQAAALIAGYLDATNSVDPGIAEMARQGGELYYELGVVASVLEWLGPDGWRKFVIDHVKTRPSTPTLQILAEEWSKPS